MRLPADGAPEDLGRGAEVDGAVGGLGVHALAEKAEVLHLLADEPLVEADLLTADDHNALPVRVPWAGSTLAVQPGGAERPPPTASFAAQTPKPYDWASRLLDPSNGARNRVL